MEPIRRRLLDGLAIPAHPLALTAERKLDERRQRALARCYVAAGAGGLAVGVHTTDFAIREHGLLRPVLALAAETARAAGRPVALIAGVCGETRQAAAEAALARELGYDAALLGPGAGCDASEDAFLAHARAVAEVLPLLGFYLQPAAGGRVLSASFWRRFAAIPEVVAIKVAPFDRYRTLDVVRAVAEAGRAGEVALYTGNDDHILLDLVTTFRSGTATLRFAGGLLGQWAIGTRAAVRDFEEARRLREAGAHVPPAFLTRAAGLTEVNAAVFDAANGFRGCLPGILEVLRRQGLVAGTWCLDPRAGLSPGQPDGIDRALAAWPELSDDAFVAAHKDAWLR